MSQYSIQCKNDFFFVCWQKCNHCRRFSNLSLSYFFSQLFFRFYLSFYTILLISFFVSVFVSVYLQTIYWMDWAASEHKNKFVLSCSKSPKSSCFFSSSHFYWCLFNVLSTLDMIQTSSRGVLNKFEFFAIYFGRKW